MPPPQGRRRSLGISRHSGIRLQLTQLFHDQDHTYLQLSVRNRSRMPYLPAQLSAEYVQPVRRRRATYLAADRHPLTAVFQDMTARISPDSTGWIRLVFPQFAPRRRSRLVLYLREQEGTRNLTLSLPMRKVLYARFLRDHTLSFPPPALDSLSVHP